MGRFLVPSASRELPEVGKLVPADEAQLRQHRIVAGGGVTLAQHKAVTVGIFGILGIDAHVVVEYAGHQFHHGQGAAGMAAACVGDHGDDVTAHLLTYAGKFCRIH